MKVRQITRLKAKARSDLALRHNFLEKDLLLEANQDIICHYFWLPLDFKVPDLDTLDKVIKEDSSLKKLKRQEFIDFRKDWDENREECFIEIDKFLKKQIALKLRKFYINVRNNTFNFPEACLMTISESNFRPFIFKEKLVYMSDYVYQLEMLQLYARIEGKTDRAIEQPDFYGSLILSIHELLDGYILIREHLKAYLQNFNYQKEFIVAIKDYVTQELQPYGRITKYEELRAENYALVA